MEYPQTRSIAEDVIANQMDLHIKNEWLAELLIGHYDLITEYWIQDIRAEHISGYDHFTDEQLREELPPTVDSMIYAFQTGDLEGPRRHSLALIRKRLDEGFYLPALQGSLHALQVAVMRIVMKECVSPEKRFEAMWATSDAYYTVALIAAEVYEELRTEQQRQNALLFEEAKGKRELAVLLDASKLFTSSLDIRDILNKVVTMATESTKADLAVAYIPSFQQSGLHNIAYYSRNRKARYAIRHIEEIIALGGEDSSYGSLIKCVAEKHTILFGSYAESPRWLRPVIGAINSGMIMPLKQKGMPIGVFALLSLEQNAFTKSDLSLAAALADLAAVAIENSRLYEYERRIAETLQRSFLPVNLPGIEGHEIAAYYRPAMAEAVIGGDFYDVFRIGDGRIGIVIADVSGKGLQAAVQTAMGKYMIRAYAVENPSPEDVLMRFNRAFHEYKSEDQFLTAFYGILEQRDSTFTYVSAGHNPPLLYSDARHQVAQIKTAGISIGVLPDVEYEKKSIRLQPGDALLLYTDGATDVKRNDERLEVEGLQELFLSTAHMSVAKAVECMSTGISKYGHGKLPDDIALVLLKRLP